jgi:beta-glucosidase
MTRAFLPTAVTAAFLPGIMILPADEPTYRNAAVPCEERVEDLLRRMTREEKLAQIHQDTHAQFFKPGIDEESLAGFFQGMSRGGISVFELSPEQLVEFANSCQDHVASHSRLGIPLLIITETLHGLLTPGATVYPQTIAQGSTWNLELIERMAAEIAAEGRALGVNQSLSPMVTLARDPRWGRIEECFSECPNLTAAMALAYVRGMQGRDYPDQPLPDDKMLCMSKVMAAYEIPRAGINIAGASVGERELRSVYLVPHEVLVRQGRVASLMPSYHCIDGVPCHASRWLLTEVPRGEWGFDGYVYADWGGVGMNFGFHQVAASLQEGAELAITAGLDMEAPSGAAFATLGDSLAQGRLDQAVVDTAVRRILRAKFRAGLFDDPPRADLEQAGRLLRSDAHKATARRIAEESIILLKNEDEMLPLDPKKLKKIALIGPNADQVQFGDYSAVAGNRWGVTTKNGVDRWAAEHGFEVGYARGCHWVGRDRSRFEEAVALAKASDIAVVVVGDTSMCIGGGVAGGEDERAIGSLATVGEGYDRTALTIPGVQEDLVWAVCETGTPVVLVLVNGRPFAIPEMKEKIPAIVGAFYPGEEGGHAIADVLFGKVNPSGKLTVSIPQSVGHIPNTYDHHPADLGIYRQRGTLDEPGRDYVFSSPDPLWPFGFGLSYTQFAYTDLVIDHPELTADGTVRFRFTVKNVGQRAGQEVAQVYFRDEVSSVTTPMKRLIRFEKIPLGPGESRVVEMEISASELALWNREMKRVVEPGAFTLMVGGSSADLPLNDRFFVAGNPVGAGPVDHARRPASLPELEACSRTGHLLNRLARSPFPH